MTIMRVHFINGDEKKFEYHSLDDHETSLDLLDKDDFVIATIPLYNVKYISYE